MIDVQSEKIRISELAIRGFLSQRASNSVSVDSIITNIKKTRGILIKNKKSKISKIAPMIEDTPFVVPDGWKWVALGDLCVLLSRGKSPKYSEKKKYPVFAQKCNQPDGLALEKALFLDESTLEKWPEYFRLRNEDVVINSTGTGTVGRVGYYLNQTLDSQYEFMVPDSHVTVVRTGENIVSKYIYYALRTNTIQSIMEKTYRGSTNQKEFYIDSVYSIPVPVPSFEEQQQIVSILDNVFEQLNIIDALQKQYESDREILKGKIIDAGIRGKLTEQLPEDGSAEDLYTQIQEEKAKLIKEGKIKKENHLPEISDDEIPFEIPYNWKWVRMGDIASVYGGKRIPAGRKLTTENTGHKYIRVSEMKDRSVVTEGLLYVPEDIYPAISRYIINKEDVYITVAGTIVKVGKIPEEIDGANLTENADRLVFNNLNQDWLIFALSSSAVQKQIERLTTQVAQPKLAIQRIQEFMVPLPPQTEQNRIANTISGSLEIFS